MLTITVVKIKIELNSHADTCVVCHYCLVVYDHNRQVNVFGYDPKVGSKKDHIVNAAVTYTEPETGHPVILLINQAIEMNGLDHHLLCPMQCCMNGVRINEVPKFLASETMHAKQLENPFDATHPIFIPMKLNGVTSYLKVRTPI